MSEYIKRENVVSIIEKRQKELCPVGQYGRGYVYGSDREKYDTWEEIIDEIENLPTSDVAEVRHGHWIMHDDPILGLTCECSECRIETCGDTKYCPVCGAKMDKVMCIEI